MLVHVYSAITFVMMEAMLLIVLLPILSDNMLNLYLSALNQSAGWAYRGPPCILKVRRKAPRLVVIKTGQDHTDRMVLWAHKRLEQLFGENLAGFIFKKKSPSCGMAHVNVFGSKGRPIKKGQGIFAAMFIKRFPLIPVEEEGRLNEPLLRENFIERIFAMKHWRAC